jgi:hypothetical protein
MEASERGRVPGGTGDVIAPVEELLGDVPPEAR